MLQIVGVEIGDGLLRHLSIKIDCAQISAKEEAEIISVRWKGILLGVLEISMKFKKWENNYMKDLDFDG